MCVYLMRHGAAREPDEWEGSDETRPLTAEGRKRVLETLRALKKKHGLEVSKIWSSPYTRAWQTAEAAKEILHAKLQPCSVLASGAALEELAALMKRHRTEPLMLIGHEPALGELLSCLLGESGARPFKKAAVVCLKGRFRAGGMKLKWFLSPKDVLKD